MQAHQVYNLYNFRDDDPDIWTYDITSCFDVRSLRQIQMTFTGKCKMISARVNVIPHVCMTA